MSFIEIIPAIDMIDGKCVRLSQGDYNQKKIYFNDPLDVALMFESNGIKRLHLVDLDGAKAGRIINHKILEKIAAKTNLIIDFGGGVKSTEDLEIAFKSGAQMVTGGSIAVRNPADFKEWIHKYGGDKIILGADVKDERIAVSGWQEDSGTELMPFIESYMNDGITKAICTDISKDGMLEGPSFDLYQKIMNRFPNLKLIASGGVTTIAEIDRLVEMNVYGVIIGKAIYEESIRLEDLAKYYS